MVVSQPDSSVTALPSGLCTIVVVSEFGDLGANAIVGGAETVQIGHPAQALPPWVQGHGRGSAADACLDGWTASWDQRPHGGTGGWVCTRSVPSLG